MSLLDMGKPRWGPQRMLKMMHREKKTCTTSGAVARPAFFDIRLADSDATKCCRYPALAVLAQQEQQKKTKYLERCLKMRRDFNALVYLADGMIGEDVSVSEKCVA